MGILDFLFPKKCVGCRRWGSYVCEDCFDKLKWLREQICPMCCKNSVGGLTHFRCRKKWGMEGLTSLVAYEGVAKKLIAELKFKLVSDLVEEVMGKILARVEGGRFSDRDWVVVPVPLHQGRLSWRGFNQAEEIGKAITGKWHLAYSELLIKIKDTGQQVGKKREERWRGVRDSFGLRTKNQLPKAILLVDDVWTSGATMRECAKMLKRAGVKQVWGWTLARRVWVE